MKKRNNKENFTKDTPFEEVLPTIEPLIRRISRETKGVYGIEREDMEQVLRIRALKSWKTWDPDKGVPFFNYVYDALIKCKNYRVRTAKADCRGGGQRPVPLDKMPSSGWSQNGRYSFRAVSTEEDDCNPEMYSHIQEILEVLKEVLNSMRERAREIVSGILDGYTQVEVAKNAGVSQPNVSYHLNEFRKKMREALERRGFELPFADKRNPSVF